MRIDFHSHAFPPSLRDEAVSFAEEHDERLWLETVPGIAGSPGGSVQGWLDCAEMVEAYRAAGVEGAVLLGWYWEGPTACSWHNQLMAQWVRTNPGFFRFFAAVPPSADPATVRAILEEAATLGAVGVGELHCGVQGFTVDSPGWREVCQFCKRAGWPVNFHLTDPHGALYPGRRETPAGTMRPLVESLLEAEVPVVLAHLAGGAAMSGELFPDGAVPDGVYVDTAALPRLYRVRDWARQAGFWLKQERVLWASDFPLRLYPKLEVEAGLQRFATDWAASGLHGTTPEWVVGFDGDGQ